MYTGIQTDGMWSISISANRFPLHIALYSGVQKERNVIRETPR